SVRSLIEHGPSGEKFTDTVGVLTSWDEGVLRITRRGGESVRIPESALVAGKTVPAAPARRRGPAASYGELARVASRAWPPTESARLGDWELRAAAAGPAAGRGADGRTGLVRGARAARVRADRDRCRGHPGGAGRRAGAAGLGPGGDRRGVGGRPGPARRPARAPGPGGAVPDGGRGVAGPVRTQGPRRGGAARPGRGAVGVVRDGARGRVRGRRRGGGARRDRPLRGGRPVGRVRRGGGGSGAAAGGARHGGDGRAGPPGARRGRVGGLA